MTDPINLTQLRNLVPAYLDAYPIGERPPSGSVVVDRHTLLALIDTAEAAYAYVTEDAAWKDYDRLRESLTRYTTE